MVEGHLTVGMIMRLCCLLWVVLSAARCLWCVVCCVMYPVCCVLCVVCAVARANLVVRQEAYEVLEYNFSIFRDYGAQLFTTATS